MQSVICNIITLNVGRGHDWGEMNLLLPTMNDSFIGQLWPRPSLSFADKHNKNGRQGHMPYVKVYL